MLTGSLWRKGLVTLVAMSAFVWLYEATVLDSFVASRVRGVTEAEPAGPSPAPPGAQLAFAATAYCKGQVTSAGVAPRRGVAAGDPAVLPLGSIVQIDARDSGVDGVYTILDTGPEIQGRRVDLYMWSCNEALAFGRQSVRLTVLRMGWNPRATTRSFMDRLFRPEPPEDPEPEAAALLPSRPRDGQAASEADK
jgi:3D (Asp-Asp-Asp) domain-containing protein